MSRRTSADRKSRTSELSLNLDDLEDFCHHRASALGRGSGEHNMSSGLSLSSWAHEPEATTGNLMAGVSSTLGGFLQYPSLDSVLEDNDEEFPINTMIRTNENTNENCCQDRSRLRHYSDDDSPVLGRLQWDPKTLSSLARSRSWDGKNCGSLPEIDLGRDGNQRGKRVHFEAPARLEEIREFEKPDFEDYNNLYYMAHEIQKMMDDFRVESALDRHIVR
ncbi:hypothetical protein IV203_011939 [Nitzschia inconspicua]|uniref:Uncharacterized protein n=1 Tax=Nitzschia inconspicua TaxID=303405 RepID=A0A9K3KTL3_9STRA|nr:hypothetical protein IV203_011939 [Nitzschia inconspicua]